MANSDKEILITPNKGQSSFPEIKFTGANNTPTYLRVLDDATVSIEGTNGQLFSVTDSMTGTIFSVNDVSGIPAIEVLDTGRINIGTYGGSLFTSGITASGGFLGTGSSAGVLGGITMQYACERSGVGTAGNIMAYGNGVGAGKGLRMPFAGKLIAATLSGVAINGTVTVDAYLNAVTNTSYRLTATGTTTDIGVTQDWSSSPLSFSAGATLAWIQTAVPTAATSYNVSYFIRFD